MNINNSLQRIHHRHKDEEVQAGYERDRREPHRHTCGCRHAGAQLQYQDLLSHPDIWTSWIVRLVEASMIQPDPTLLAQLSELRASVPLH